jgi:hypothetical protein
MMSAILGGERVVYMDAEHEQQGNGHGTPPPLVLPGKARMPIKTRIVHLEDDYAGFSATIRTNAPFGLFLTLSELQAGGDDNMAGVRAFGELIRILPSLVIAWDVCDEEGNAIPCNADGFRAVPAELLMALIGKLGAGETVPKA